MLFFAFIVVLCVVGHVNAAWYAGRQVNTLLGVTTGKNNKNEVYGAGYDGTEEGGFVFYSGDRANLPGTIIRVGTGINFDITINEDKTDLVVVGANAIYYGKPEGASSKFDKAPFTNVVSQDVQPIKGTGKKIAAIGRFDGTNGVAVTSDGGATWESKDIGSSEESGLLARYGSFPSANTWYVSAGTWPWDSDARLTNGNVARVSARLSIFYDIGDGTPQTTFLSAKKLLGTYPGAIFKPTDGGNTWNQVYNSGGKHYLNQIDCVSESNCVAVGEDAKSAIVLSTTDGGATWQKKLELSGPYSLHAVKMLSANEYFVGGGAPSVGPYQSKEIVGYYYHTTDGGQNFALTQMNGYAYDFTYWDGTQGYAAALFKKNSYVWIWQ